MGFAQLPLSSDVLPYILPLALLLVLPLLLIVALWRSTEIDRCRWLLKALYSGVFLAYLLAVGRWDFGSVYLRYVFALLYVVAAARSFRAVHDRPFFAQHESTPRVRSYVGPVLLLVFFSGFLAWAVRGYFYSDAAVELELPLRDGWYYVGQGGNSVSVNYHNAIEPQQYALDIVALNRWGLRARGLYPEELTSYVIFGEPLYSPCDGQVEAAVDGLSDQIPPDADRTNVAGNHVVISCKDVLVLLAHLREGSVQVRKGEMLNAGTLIGRVGNSGNTSEPHLHLHAVRAGSGDILNGIGVPIVMDGVFPVRNTTFRVRE